MSPRSSSGQRRPPSLRDVAELAGVSIKTVSNVINDYPFIKLATRARVLHAIEELGRRPAFGAVEPFEVRIDLGGLHPADVTRLLEIASTLARHGIVVVARRGPFIALRLRRRAPRALAVALREIEVIARRNPNLVLLTLATLLGRPDLGILAVAAWTAFGCVEQAVVTAQAALARRRGGPLRSWLEG